MTPDDPVEEFFAHERAQVRPLPTDEPHWSSLVVEARRERRARRMRYATSAAAAVLVAGAGLGWALHPGSPSTVATLGASSTSRAGGSPSAAVTATPRSTASTGAPATRTTTPTQTTIAVPASFHVVSLSNVGGGTLYALGTTTCGSSRTPCPALARTTDDGASWRLVSSFPRYTVGGGGTGAGQVGTDTSLTQVRFASPQVGWVFGGALRMTTDGGRTWTDIPHSGRAVVDLETDGTTVAVTTSGGGCDGQTCSGSVVADVSAVLPWSPSRSSAALGSGQVTSADVVFHGGVAYTSAVGDGHLGGAWRVNSSLGRLGLSCQSLSAGSSGSAADAAAPRLVSPASGSTIFAVCPTGAAAGTAGYGVLASSDGDGMSWSVRSGSTSAPALTLVDSGTTSFAATDASHLIAVSGGSADLGGSMTVSSDGGRTWHAPASPPPAPAAGWSWVGAPGGRTLYAVPTGGAAGFWVSTDAGEHWREVRVAGR